MKKNITLLFVTIAVFCSQIANAQKTNDEATLPKKNIIKLNLSSLIFSNFSLQYERVLTRKSSIALGLSVMPKTGLPFAKTLKDKYGSNSDAARAIDETRLSNFSITPEYRFYLGKKGAPTGFYVAPFVRYNHLNFNQFYRFTPSDNKQHVANIVGSINNIGGGLLIGTQWNLSKKLTLDWWIAGPIYGSSKGTLTGTDPMDIPAADRPNIKRDIESLDIPATKIQAAVGKNQIDVTLDGPYVGLRAFGFALGIKF
jgi:hypothetical protein